MHNFVLDGDWNQLCSIPRPVAELVKTGNASFCLVDGRLCRLGGGKIHSIMRKHTRSCWSGLRVPVSVVEPSISVSAILL